MKILTFSTLFPNAARPTHGVFVETRLRQLVASGEVESKVIAPVPWFPFTGERFGEYGAHARAPHEETRHGIEVLHPRYPVLPKIGMSLAPFLLYRATLPAAQRLLERHPFDLIDAHYFYPDGVAAAMLGRRLGKPVVITARGTDVNVIPNHVFPGRMIRWAAAQAAGVIAVSQSLKHSLVGLGVPDRHIVVLRNGVDLRLFRPLDRQTIRRRLGFTRQTLLSVGNLLDFKGHDLSIRALLLLREWDLVIVGSGRHRPALEHLVRELGLTQRVRFAGTVQHNDLPEYYSASDALVLASSREGWPNVLLEAMACGTPVLATRVGGCPEVVTSAEAGELVDERTPQSIAGALSKLLHRSLDRSATRAYAERFGWAPTTQGQLSLFEGILRDKPFVREAGVAL